MKKEIDAFVPSARYLGTKSADPLVRWSEVDKGPLRVCKRCKGAFTPLGLTKHTTACKEK